MGFKVKKKLIAFPDRTLRHTCIRVYVRDTSVEIGILDLDELPLRTTRTNRKIKLTSRLRTSRYRSGSKTFHLIRRSVYVEALSKHRCRNELFWPLTLNMTTKVKEYKANKEKSAWRQNVDMTDIYSVQSSIQRALFAADAASENWRSLMKNCLANELALTKSEYLNIAF